METLHVGKFVLSLVDDAKMKHIDFAKAMNYSPSNINSLFNREDWRLKMILKAEVVLDKKILIHFIKLPENKDGSDMVMEDSPSYIIGKQSEKLKHCEKERAEGKQVLEIVLEQNRYLKEKLKHYEM